MRRATSHRVLRLAYLAGGHSQEPLNSAVRMPSSSPRLPESKPARPGWRLRLHTIIFESDTPAGAAFDIALLVLIVASIVAVCLDSVEGFRTAYGSELRYAEWFFTGLFAVEYVLRLLSVRYPWRYARSFFGVVDLLAVLPTPLSLVVPGAQSMLVVRVVRLLRVFRILKLASFLWQATVLVHALRASRQKITVFLGAVLTLVVFAGALMYLVEGPQHGFDSIPRGMYWAIVTVTTVGFGDITPKTPLGQTIAAVLMIMGYGIIAVPTGIVSVELANASRRFSVSSRACPGCGHSPHEDDAVHCKRCGAPLAES
jgi:voltage-gated potassium channel